MNRTDFAKTIVGGFAGVTLSSCAGGGTGSLLAPSSSWRTGASVRAFSANGINGTTTYDSAHVFISAPGIEYEIAELSGQLMALRLSFGGGTYSAMADLSKPGFVQLDNGSSIKYGSNGSATVHSTVLPSGARDFDLSISRNASHLSQLIVGNSVITVSSSPLVEKSGQRRVQACSDYTFYASAFGAASLAMLFIPGLQVGSAVSGGVAGAIDIYAYLSGC